MKRFAILLIVILVIFGAASPHTSIATPIVINPSSDGSLYTCDGCNPNPVNLFLLVGSYIQGAVIFPTAEISGSISQALFSVNPYALPLFAPSIGVYGFTSNSSQVAFSNAN